MFLSSRRILLFVIAISAALVIAAILWFSRETIDLAHETAPSKQGESAYPPWIYGRTDARFTIVEYADLECAYCRAYFPVMRRWINDHPEVNLQWHHLPLSIHEPTATQAAQLAECVGENEGNTAFWNTIDRIYKQGHASRVRLAAEAQLSAPSAAVQACLEAGSFLARIQEQAAAAAREGITTTPTLRLIDRETGKELTLHGPTEGDALLSAIDLLTSVSESSRIAK